MSAIRVRLFQILIVIAGLFAYYNSFAGAFLLDDRLFILENPDIRQLWPFWKPLSGIRPVVDLTLSLNYALGGPRVWGYHAVNLAIHLLAALTLFGIVRRTLENDSLKVRFGSSSAALAAAVSVLWVAHPLQTQPVNYLIQRAELLMGLFYLLTLYCLIRSAEDSASKRWPAAAVLCCALGMGSKAVMVTAPWMALLYDRTFFSSSFSEAFSKRGRIYIGLAATWGILAGLLWTHSAAAEIQAGLKTKSFTLAQYLSTQPAAILQYLKLSFWPHPLVFAYDWPIPRSAAAVLPPGILIAGLIAGTFQALRRGWGIGFLGAWLFLILAPTSLTPLADPLFEHRMYLPLAAVVAWIVLGGYRMGLRGRLAAGLICVCAIGLAGLTLRRNLDYRSDASIWSDTVSKQPNNRRALINLGKALMDRGDLGAASAQFNRVLQLDTDNLDAHNSMGNLLSAQGKFGEAAVHFEKAARLKPNAETITNLGLALANLGRMEEALQAFGRALRFKPDPAGFYKSVGLAFTAQGKSERAVSYLQESLKINPEDAQAHSVLGNLFFRQGQMEKAIPHYAQVLRLKPDWVEDRCNLGIALASQGRLKEAISQYHQALRLKPDAPEAHNNLGNALARQGKLKEAIDQYTQALQFNPDFAEAHYNLGLCLGSQGRWEEANRHFERSGRQPPPRK